MGLTSTWMFLRAEVRRGWPGWLSVASPSGLALIAPEDDRIPGHVWGRKIVAGRAADAARADEAEVSFVAAQERHLHRGARGHPRWPPSPAALPGQPPRPASPASLPGQAAARTRPAQTLRTE